MSDVVKNRELKIKLLIEKGYTCNPETGEVFGMHGKLMSRKHKCGYGLLNGRYKVDGRYIGKQYNVLSHQFIFFYVNGYCPEMIDHINRDKSDNRICNLRPTTQQQNSFNTDYAKGFSKIKYADGYKYQARIKLNYKNILLGIYDTEDEARNAYLEAKKKYHS